MADNYVFKNLIWKFAGLNLILSAIGKWYTFQLLSGTLFNYHIHSNISEGCGDGGWCGKITGNYGNFCLKDLWEFLLKKSLVF